MLAGFGATQWPAASATADSIHAATPQIAARANSHAPRLHLYADNMTDVRPGKPAVIGHEE